MCRSLTPRVWMKVEDEAGELVRRPSARADPNLVGVRADLRSRRFGDGCVVIRDGANRSRSSQRNQSIVPLSEPPIVDPRRQVEDRNATVRSAAHRGRTADVGGVGRSHLVATRR